MFFTHMITFFMLHLQNPCSFVYLSFKSRSPPFVYLSVRGVDPRLVLLSICLSKVCPLLIILSICLSRVDLFLITLTICPSRVGPVLVFFSICLSGVSYRYLPCFFPYAKDRSPPCPFVYLSAKSMSLRYLFCRPSVSEG